MATMNLVALGLRLHFACGPLCISMVVENGRTGQNIFAEVALTYSHICHRLGLQQIHQAACLVLVNMEGLARATNEMKSVFHEGHVFTLAQHFFV